MSANAAEARPDASAPEAPSDISASVTSPGADAAKARPSADSPDVRSDAGRAARIRRDPSEWDAFVAASPEGSFLQLTAWARANAVKGWRVSRLALPTDGRIIGAQILVHRMRPSPWSRGYAPRGPIAEAFDATAVADFTASIRTAARRLRLSHMVIDPALPAGHSAEAWLLAQGWRRINIIQSNRTRVLDLTLSEETLWSGLRSSARWSVNKARRSGYAIDDAGEAGLDDFERIFLETARRVGFEAGAAFRTVYREFAADGAARLLLARAPGGEAVATLMLLSCGQKIIEIYGASTRDGARGRANYLIKWEAIRSSRERGFSSYDVWGTDQEGLAEFKAGFGGDEHEYIGAWELVTDRPGRWVVDAVGRAREVATSLRQRGAREAATAGEATREESVHAVRVAEVSSVPPDGWDELTVAAPGGHVMQGTAWAEHRRAQGSEPRFVRFDDGRAALVILRRSPGLPGATASVRRGPVHTGDGPERLAARAAALADHMRGEGVRDLFLDPELDADPAYDAAMDRHGFAVAEEVQPSIHVMRLTFPEGATEESLLAAVSKSSRQRIRSAEKAGIVVREDPAGERLEEFGALLVERADDLGITLRPELGYLASWRHLLVARQARLFLAEREGDLLGGLLLFVQGGMLSTAYSADDAASRRRFPGTMHLLRWTVIRAALAAGSPSVELGGVDLPGYREPPRADEPNHGLFEHKRSFGAEWVVRTPARRIVLRPWAERFATGRRAVLARARALRP